MCHNLQNVTVQLRHTMHANIQLRSTSSVHATFVKHKNKRDYELTCVKIN